MAGALALETARRHRVLVTVGVVPTRPETGFGYIVPGPALDEVAHHVARFSEKPDAATALDLMADGALWNSGLFAWTAADLREQVTRHTPELAPYVPLLDRDTPEAFFNAVTPVSIDVGLLERSTKVAVVPGSFPWDDVGTWDALARIREQDSHGSVTHGNVFLADSRDCVVWTEDDPIVCFGVKDLVVVRANGRILVAHRQRAADLKKLLEQLPDDVREVE
jgi:mannose-1-phosphate guanylyltransferase